ncbi:MAG: AmmeMemoRadiSam system protein B [Candidatus Omnitrophica bacterium]|nr:AmmeMemoRadiSam system protein B [Candidatus Omnitrophota bacterium]
MPRLLKNHFQGLLVPHAGYQYSGRIAALAYRLLKGKKVDTVVLLGRSHQARFKGAIIDDRQFWQTPLGKVELDAELFGYLYKDDHFHVNQFLLDNEHSLEVQVPFIQMVASQAKIFPLLLGEASEDNLQKVVLALKTVMRKRPNMIFVASSDMSHYHSLDKAEEIDRHCLKLLEKKDFSGLKEALETRRVELCGDAAVLTLLSLARGQKSWAIKCLGYSTSAESTRDRSRVVGYGALVITIGENKKEGEESMFNQEQKRTLLKIARETIVAHLKGQKWPATETEDLVLREKRGVFVTLRRKRDHQLRGCIGLILPELPLIEAVQKMAIEAATGDPRFSPVSLAEMNDVEIEISVLSVPRKVKGAEEVVLGRDGVIIKRGFRQGVFLPQVAEETGWGKEEFLSNLCAHKAGLPADAWKEKDTEIYTFQAEVFSE